MIDSKEFNKEFICKVDSPIYKGLAGYYLTISLLGVKAEKVLNKVFASKDQKVRCKPFHGETYTFYRR